MLLLRLTSDPVLRGMKTDDGFTIGVVSTDTLFLLGVTAGLGIVGGLYLPDCPWLDPEPLARGRDDDVRGPRGWRRPDISGRDRLQGALAAAARGRDVRRDRRCLRCVMPWLTERMLREDLVTRRRPSPSIVGLLPLAVANIVAILVLGARDAGTAR